MHMMLKDEEMRPSLAYKVLSAHNTKKLMNIETVDELAWYAISLLFCTYSYMYTCVKYCIIK